jgi:hypothetical protein
MQSRKKSNDWKVKVIYVAESHFRNLFLTSAPITTLARDGDIEMEEGYCLFERTTPSLWYQRSSVKNPGRLCDWLQRSHLTTLMIHFPQHCFWIYFLSWISSQNRFVCVLNWSRNAIVHIISEWANNVSD